MNKNQSIYSIEEDSFQHDNLLYKLIKAIHAVFNLEHARTSAIEFNGKYSLNASKNKNFVSKSQS
jgi:hypothetical protein